MSTLAAVPTPSPAMPPPGGAMPPPPGGTPPASTMAPPGGGDGPPAAGGMATPQSPDGKIAGAKVQIMTATKVLIQALSAFPMGGKEFKAVMGAISGLEKAFGQDEDSTKELMPTEMKNLIQGVSGPGQMGGAPRPPSPPPGAAPPPM